MFLTPERTILTRVGTIISEQIADAEVQLSQLPDSPERDSVNLRLGELSQATERFDHLIGMLSEQKLPAPSRRFITGISRIAETMQ